MGKGHRTPLDGEEGHGLDKRGRGEDQFCAGWISVGEDRGGFLVGTHDGRFVEGE